MGGRAPGFWWRGPGWRSAVLSPFAFAYGAAAGWRLDHGERADAGIPVLCVGNLTVGGGGKTPTVLALGETAKRLGLKPGFLSRGHGGALREAALVDLGRHDAAAVGDEPMLLARSAPTAVAVDRKKGAELLRRQAGVDLIIMDDGFQSARLRADFTLLVVDSARGIGNGRVVPAGPLRAPAARQIRAADAFVIVGDGAAGAAVRRSLEGAGPVFAAALRPRAAERLAGRRVLAFAGIADPAKFYRSLQELGADVTATRDFPDHHAFSGAEIADLSAQAERGGLVPVTTRKDAVRLEGGHAAARRFFETLEVLDVDLVLEPEGAPAALIRQAVEAFRRRTGR